MTRERDPNEPSEPIAGTTERMIGESGVVTQWSVYTAFGELAYQAGVGQTRYGYCGAWGYESASGVGWRRRWCLRRRTYGSWNRSWGGSWFRERRDWVRLLRTG